MKFVATTDLHYGFDQKTHKIHEKFLQKIKMACDTEKVDAVIHCGDWIANNQHQLPRTFKMFREALGDLPILGVLGNHDRWSQEYWNTSLSRRAYASPEAKLSLSAMEIQHRDWAAEFNIHLLERTPFVFKDVVVYGFNGWYGNANPPTNDAANMPRIYETAPTHAYLSHQAGKELDWIFGDIEKIGEGVKKICVTHFPPYTKSPGYEAYCANESYLDFITEKFDLLLVGHSHREEDWINEFKGHTCRVVNPGTNFDQFSGGYNKPNFIILDV